MVVINHLFTISTSLPFYFILKTFCKLKFNFSFALDIGKTISINTRAKSVVSPTIG